MKKYIIILISVFSFIQNIFADEITIPNVIVTNNEYSLVNVELNNSKDDIVGFQFNLNLPDEILPEAEKGKIIVTASDRLAGNRSLTGKKVADGSYLFVYMSTDRTPIRDDNGCLFSFKIKNTSEKSGQLKGTVRDIVVTNLDGIEDELDATTFNIELNQIRNLVYKVDGVVYKTVSYSVGSAITPEEAPEKEGYTFSGWSEIPETMPAHDVEVTGTFAVNQYKVTFIADGETVKEETLDFGSTIEAPENPAKTGYTFAGWTPEVDATVPAHDVTYTAIFTINQYTITFDTDGGSEVSSIAQDYGTGITAPDAPTKEGYTFAGWDKEIPATMPAENMTIKALWTINKYKLTYKVDAEVYKEYEVEYNSEITPEEAPEKEGYTFSGWSEIPETMPAHDVEVTGTFTKNLIPGDVNQDGVVNINDIAALVHILTHKESSSYDTKTADVNNDGKIDIQDITLLVNKVVKK